MDINENKSKIQDINYYKDTNAHTVREYLLYDAISAPWFSHKNIFHPARNGDNGITIIWERNHTLSI